MTEIATRSALLKIQVTGRPHPLPTLLSRPFWEGGRDGQLMVARCKDCGYWLHPPAPVCSQCLSREVGPQPTGGRGKVISFTVNYQRWYDGPELPYVVAVIELDEQVGLRLTTNIVNCRVEDVCFDLPVHVVFMPLAEDVYLPLFELSESER